jgi:hypothetical protein
LIFTASLSLVAAATLTAHPSWGIVVSSTGIVYFSDLETVWKIDRDGKMSVFRAGASGHHVHELSIDSQDNIYGPITAYDSTTQKYLIGVWKMTADGRETELQRPVDSVMSGISIWRDSAGNMYSIEQNNNLKERTLLLKRTPDGSVLTLAGGALWLWGWPGFGGEIQQRVRDDLRSRWKSLFDRWHLRASRHARRRRYYRREGLDDADFRRQANFVRW